MFRKNIDTIATWSVFLVHRSGSFFNIDFKHFKEVKGAGIIFFLLCGMEGSYFLLFWRNKRITMTRDDITYRSIWGKEKKYSWEDVRSVRYKSAGRGAYRILIQTDRKICIETGMMENSEEAEKLIKGKGYLCLH